MTIFTLDNVLQAFGTLDPTKRNPMIGLDDEGAASCVYGNHDGFDWKPSCLVGQIVCALDQPTFELICDFEGSVMSWSPDEDSSTPDSAEAWSRFDETARLTMYAAQYRADAGARWGDAMASALVTSDLEDI